jgi:hemoglobin
MSASTEMSVDAESAALEAAITTCVRSFYDKGLADPLLGPIFGAIPALDQHLDIIANFWSKALLGTERYDGHPFAVHLNLPVELEHFARWLELFTQTVHENLPPAAAEQAIAKATHMSECFQGGLFPFTGADGKPSRLPPS